MAQAGWGKYPLVREAFAAVRTYCSGRGARQLERAVDRATVLQAERVAEQAVSIIDDYVDAPAAEKETLMAGVVLQYGLPDFSWHRGRFAASEDLRRAAKEIFVDQRPVPGQPLPTSHARIAVAFAVSTLTVCITELGRNTRLETRVAERNRRVLKGLEEKDPQVLAQLNAPRLQERYLQLRGDFSQALQHSRRPDSATYLARRETGREARL